MKLLYACYRSWGFNAWRDYLNFHLGMPDPQLCIAATQEQLLDSISTFKPDVIFLAGWSWIIPDDICKNNYIVAVHPSDLPEYAGGSPIQHQILDGVENTKTTLFRVSPGIDSGNILKKLDLSLEGNIEQIFKRLEEHTVDLIKYVVDKWPNIPETIQVKQSLPRKRLKPKDSHLTNELLNKYSTKELYDFIRCREDPYPNAYIEDGVGTLLIKSVEFIPK